ncbi:histidine kinase [Paludicola sp. MB14-C6]|uniref:sensor histidine kinase n=1 Tax=Paludihabitans sp. MB14-C6 TaxID=3070656 RepID=UPI0027DE9526|nr:histidine kinase [Paludicola sp. MB14-C6]WMJ22743.1 histidine kinase [Paludicola sp. MB14-C6]
MIYNNKPRKKFRIQIIRTTTLVVLFSLISCTIVLLVSMYNNMTNFIRKDIDFFLSETSNNMHTKTIYIEDMLTELSKNTLIANHLLNVYNGKSSSTKQADIETELMKCTNLYSYDNTNGTEYSLVDKVYLFDKNGSVYRNMFSSYNRQERYGIDQLYNKLYDIFKTKKAPTQFYYLNNNLIVAYTVYSKSMENIGTAMFSINHNFINQIFSSVDNYEGSFWFAFSKEKRIIVDKNANFITTDLQKQLMNQAADNEYVIHLKDNDYIVYTRQMSMGLSCTIAIPENTIFKSMMTSTTVPLIVVCVVTLILLIMSAHIVYKLTKPLQDITEKIQVVIDGEYDAKLPNYESQEFFNISQAFNNMTNEIGYLINDVYKKQLMIKESDLKFLQSQMNPHFMFNVLNTIALKAKLDNNEDIFQMTNAFSQLAQASIYRKNTEKIKIKEEIKYIEFYLFLQRYRFGENLQYKIVCEDEILLEYYIPKLTIQVLVENAVVHGLEKTTKKGIVIVDISEIDNQLIIQVIDDGKGFDGLEGRIVPPIHFEENVGEHNHIGLNNTQEILHYYYGNKYGIVIDTDQENGTTVTVNIPIEIENN